MKKQAMPTMRSAYTPTTIHAVAPNFWIFLKLPVLTAFVRMPGADSPPAMMIV